MFLKYIRRDFCFWPWRNNRNHTYTPDLSEKRETNEVNTMITPSLLPKSSLQAAVQEGKNQRVSPAVSLRWGGRDRVWEDQGGLCLWDRDTEKKDCTERKFQRSKKGSPTSLAKFGSVHVRRNHLGPGKEPPQSNRLNNCWSSHTLLCEWNDLTINRTSCSPMKILH